MRQGSCSAAVGTAERLDRLAGLQKVITPTVVRQCLEETGRGEQRSCHLSHEVMLWVVLAMGLFTEVPIRQVFKRSRFARPGEAAPSRSALCQGRQRLGVQPVCRLFHRVVRSLATPDTCGAFYQGYRLMGIDSVVYDLPDTATNEAALGRPSGGHRGAGAFPQLRKVSLLPTNRAWRKSIPTPKPLAMTKKESSFG